MEYRRLWIALGIILAISFLTLGGVGYKGIKAAPPMPTRVVTTSGVVLFGGETIMDGQNAWQSIGGQEIGSIFGHGAYVAPDWTADYLHRERVLILEEEARNLGSRDFASLTADQKAMLEARLVRESRVNTYDAATGTLTVSQERGNAFATLAAHYGDVFAKGRKEYAIPAGTLTDVKKLRDMTAFFFWTSWVSSTQRPGSSVTYTQNWPHEPLAGNRPTTASIMWSIASVILLLGGIGGMIWYFGSRTAPEHQQAPDSDPLLNLRLTPSQKATLKYFLVVVVLFLLQICIGGILAHYGVEGDGFFGFNLAQFLPY